MAENINKPHIKDLTLNAELVAHSYMPFIKGGGLFIADHGAEYKLGEEIFLKIDLENYTEPFRIIGQIVWLSSEQDASDWSNGFGVQLLEEEGRRFHQQIQSILAELDTTKG
jgi:Tfp pilus assembly protein PilZ